MLRYVTNYDQLLIKKDPESLVSYKGPITPSVIAAISEQLREEVNISEKVTNRLFSIFIELAQNMQYYSSEVIRYAKEEERIGWIQIFEKADRYELNCGNALEQGKVQKLAKHCDIINQLNRDELRKLKRERRRTKLDKAKKGAGIGLVQVAILAGNPLEVNTLNLGKKYSCIVLKITINK